MLDAEQQSISCSAPRSCRWLARGIATFFGDLRMRDGHSTSANLFYLSYSFFSIVSIAYSAVRKMGSFCRNSWTARCKLSKNELLTAGPFGRPGKAQESHQSGAQ